MNNSIDTSTYAGPLLTQQESSAQPIAPHKPPQRSQDGILSPLHHPRPDQHRPVSVTPTSTASAYSAYPGGKRPSQTVASGATPAKQPALTTSTGLPCAAQLTDKHLQEASALWQQLDAMSRGPRVPSASEASHLAAQLLQNLERLPGGRSLAAATEAARTLSRLSDIAPDAPARQETARAIQQLGEFIRSVQASAPSAVSRDQAGGGSVPVSAASYAELQQPSAATSQVQPTPADEPEQPSLDEVLEFLRQPDLKDEKLKKATTALNQHFSTHLNAILVSGLHDEANNIAVGQWLSTMRAKINDEQVQIVPAQKDRAATQSQAGLLFLTDYLNNPENRKDGVVSRPATATPPPGISTATWVRLIRLVFHPLEDARSDVGAASHCIDEYLRKAETNQQSVVQVADILNSAPAELQASILLALHHNPHVYQCTTSTGPVKPHDRVQFRNPRQTPQECQSLLEQHIRDLYKPGQRFNVKDLGPMDWNPYYVQFMAVRASKTRYAILKTANAPREKGYFRLRAQPPEATRHQVRSGHGHAGIA